jgi:alpha-tubulin suppressor-like RCC1 family protein
MTLPLLSLPTDIAVRIIKMLPLPTCARFCYVYSDAQELVVQALRGRAVDAGRAVPSQLPGHEMSWLQALLWREWWQITHRAPSLALAMCHSLVIGKEGELLTCGHDSMDDHHQILHGLTGHGPRQYVHKFTAIPTLLEVRIVAVAAGPEHSLAVSEAGHLFSWGCGWLGHGDDRGRDIPTQVTEISEVREVAAGYRSSLAIDRSGVAYTWGEGILGHSSRHVEPGETRVKPGDRQICAFPTRLDASPEPVCSAAAGATHFLAIGESGALYSWGWYSNSATFNLQPKRVEALQERVSCVSANALWNITLTVKGNVFTWGCQMALGHGEGIHALRLVPTKVQALPQCVVSVSAGDTHAMALTRGGDLYTWGGSRYGALGHGGCNEQLTPKKVTHVSPRWNGQAVIKIAAGWHTSVAIMDGGIAWGWGYSGCPAGALGMHLTDLDPMVSGHMMRIGVPEEYPEAHEWC